MSVDYDDILKHIGQFGPWQRRIHLLLWLTSAASGLVVVVFSFTAFNLNYRCQVPYCEKSDGTSLTSNLTGVVSFPEEKCSYFALNDGTSAKAPSQETCDYYIQALKDPQIDKTVKSCSRDQVVFDHSVVQTSIVEDFGFTCDKSFLRQIYGAVYMLGLLFGSFIMGLISDKYGRMKALTLGIILASGSGFIGAFMPDMHSYGFFRFLTGIGGMAMFMVTFVICVEYVGAKYTMFTGIIIEVPFALGELVLALEAYLIRDWVTLQIVAHLPLLVLVGLYFVEPESPRWLLATGRVEEAKKIIKKGAKINNRNLPESIFEVIVYDL